MQQLLAVVLLALVTPLSLASPAVKQHHKHHHHKHHHKRHGDNNQPAAVSQQPEVKASGINISDTFMSNRSTGKVSGVASPASMVVNLGAAKATQKHGSKTGVFATADKIASKMRKLEHELAEHEKADRAITKEGRLEVNGPLPADFEERFAQAVSAATGCSTTQVTVTSAKAAPGQQGIVLISYQGPMNVIKSVQEQAADPTSKLANGPLRPFLVADDSESASPKAGLEAEAFEEGPEVPVISESAPRANPVKDTGFDVDTAMPYGELEPFGREDTAQELTEQSVRESDEMVDQLERAEVSEEKRAVFRALTRLRGAAITSFDGVARAQTGNIDEYNKIHKWRRTHPLHHLADEESDITKWAFPNDADF